MSEKAIVRDYFNTLGFDRWRRIYGDEQVNRVQRPDNLRCRMRCRQLKYSVGEASCNCDR